MFTCDRSYQFKTNCHNYKMFHVIPIITTKKIPIEDAQRKMRNKACQHTHTHTHTHKSMKRRKTGRVVKRNKITERHTEKSLTKWQ